MNQKFAISVLIITLSLSFFLSPAFAEDAKTEPAPAATAQEPVDIETEFSFGTVKSLAESQLVVSEYDYESNADVDVTYQVSGETAFENVASLKEVAVGDSVDVDFLVKDGQKKAVAITVEKPLPEDEEAALDAAATPQEPKE